METPGFCSSTREIGPVSSVVALAHETAVLKVEVAPVLRHKRHMSWLRIVGSMSPAIRGVMERRILVNYRVDVGTLDAVLPESFRGREVGESGKGIGGLCFMRLKNARPRFSPKAAGVSAETVTHRISAVRDENGKEAPCVYVPRRDISSEFGAAIGRSTLSTEINCADFRVWEGEDVSRIRVDCGDEYVGVETHETDDDEIKEGSVFDSLESASEFFCEEGVEYSRSGERYDGVEFCPREWGMKPVEVVELQSSFFERLEGAELDSAFRMEDIEHEWRPRRSVPAAST